MSLFLTAKKREQISDDIDDLMMKQYYCRCRIDEAKENNNQKLIAHEERKIEEIDQTIEKLKKKLR